MLSTDQGLRFPEDLTVLSCLQCGTYHPLSHKPQQGPWFTKHVSPGTLLLHPAFSISWESQHVTCYISMQSKPVSPLCTAFPPVELHSVSITEPAHVDWRGTQQTTVIALIWRLNCSFPGSLCCHCDFSQEMRSVCLCLSHGVRPVSSFSFLSPSVANFCFAYFC